MLKIRHKEYNVKNYRGGNRIIKRKEKLKKGGKERGEIQVGSILKFMLFVAPLKIPQILKYITTNILKQKY